MPRVHRRGHKLRAEKCVEQLTDAELHQVMADNPGSQGDIQNFIRRHDAMMELQERRRNAAGQERERAGVVTLIPKGEKVDD